MLCKLFSYNNSDEFNNINNYMHKPINILHFSFEYFKFTTGKHSLIFLVRNDQ